MNIGVIIAHIEELNLAIENKKKAEEIEVKEFKRAKSFLGYLKDDICGNREVILNELKIKLAETVMLHNSGEK